MNEEQTVFEHLTLSNFKKWSSTALNTFNISTIIMANNNDKIIISWAWCFCLFLFFFRVNSTGCSGEFRAVYKHFQNLENQILNILKEKLRLSYLVDSFRIAQCKQPRLVKPLLNFDKNFIFKSTDTALVQVKRAFKSYFLSPKKK